MSLCLGLRCKLLTVLGNFFITRLGQFEVLVKLLKVCNLFLFLVSRLSRFSLLSRFRSSISRMVGRRMLLLLIQLMRILLLVLMMRLRAMVAVITFFMYR